MKNEYSFIAFFEYAEDGINISFPDLPGCFSCAPANDTETAIKNAREALGLHLFGMEQDGEPIPEPTYLFNIGPRQKILPVLIDVFMPVIRVRVKTSYVKKTVSLPAWLAAAADQRNVNCSKVFQDALMVYMNMGTLSQ